MASEQSDHLAEVLGAVQDRLCNPDLALPTVRHICEALGALAKEPEGVIYAEVDADGVPALWCIPHAGLGQRQRPVALPRRRHRGVLDEQRPQGGGSSREGGCA